MDNPENSQFSDIFAAICLECKTEGKKYTDAAFPPSDISLGKQQLQIDLSYDIKWLRPQYITFDKQPAKEEFSLLHAPSSVHILQGKLGNCWMIAPLQLIAEREALLRRIFITTKKNNYGIYAFRLYKNGKPVNVIVDDYLPCDQNNKLVFSRDTRGMVWVSLVEKAMAKLNGSYSSLHSGLASKGFACLTGYATEMIKLEGQKLDEIWTNMLQMHNGGFLMTANIVTTHKPESGVCNSVNGLAANHLYGIQRVAVVEGFKLIQLQNPWNMLCWKGLWNDNCSNWTSSLRSQCSPNQGDKGIFWMSFDDFVNLFTYLDVCKVRADWNVCYEQGTLQFSSINSQPCYEIVCENATKLDITLYQYSDDKPNLADVLTDLGMMIMKPSQQPQTGKPISFSETVSLTWRRRDKSISCYAELATGRYCLLPLSFEGVSSDGVHVMTKFNLKILSSHPVKCHELHPSNHTTFLADALICCARQIGQLNTFPFLKNLGSEYAQMFGDKMDEKIFWWKLELGIGHCLIMENRSNDLHVMARVSTNTKDYLSTRYSLEIEDHLAPLTCKVLSVLTTKSKLPAEYNHSVSLKLQKNPPQPASTQQDGHIIDFHLPMPILF